MPIKAVIQHLLFTTPAEDVSYGLMDVGFDAVSVKQCLSAIDNLQKEQYSKPSLPPHKLT
jgi:hypothetical protein